MMARPVVRTSFNGGEISPELYGAVDLRKYQTGAKLIRNGEVLVQGGIAKRPGTYYVCEVKDSTKDTILIPFIKSSNDSHVLEVGDQYFRFIRFGAQMVIPDPFTPDSRSEVVSTVPGTILELATPYTADEIRELKFTFANDVVYIFHRNHSPRRLERYGLYDWALRVPEFDIPDGPTNFEATYHANLPGSDTYNPMNLPMYWMVAAVLDDGTITLPSAEATVTGDLGWHRNYVELTWDAYTPPAGRTVEQYIVYKSASDSGIYGYIAYVAGDQTSYTDRNMAPSFTDTPIRRYEGILDGANTYPAVGEFLKQRLAFANTNGDPSGLWFSRPGLFHDLSRRQPIVSDDAIAQSLAARDDQTIHHLVPFDKLLVFTENTEWLIDTAQEGILTATSIDPRIQSYYGCDQYLRPLVINERVLFVQPMGYVVRDMGYSLEANRFIGNDLTLLARHLFETHIVSWDFVEQPRSLVRAVMADGSLRTMTYLFAHQVWAWTRGDTQGQYRAVLSVPEITHDATYYIVERFLNGEWVQCIERQGAGSFVEQEDAFFVDCGLSYDQPRAITAVSYAAGNVTITVAGHGIAEGDVFRLSGIEGLVDPSDNPLVDPIFTLNTQWTAASVTTDTIIFSVGDDAPEALTDWVPGTGFFRDCVTTLSGLGHLANEPVAVLADGMVYDNLTVDEDGTLTLPHPAARVHVGLPYPFEFESLSLDSSDEAGTRKLKSVSDLSIFLTRSRGVEVSDARLGAEWVEVQPRDFEGYFEPNALLEGAYKLNIMGGWKNDAAVRVRCTGPLPITLLSIIPELEYGS